MSAHERLKQDVAMLADRLEFIMQVIAQTKTVSSPIIGVEPVKIRQTLEDAYQEYCHAREHYILTQMRHDAVVGGQPGAAPAEGDRDPTTREPVPACADESNGRESSDTSSSSPDATGYSLDHPKN